MCARSVCLGWTAFLGLFIPTEVSWTRRRPFKRDFNGRFVGCASCVGRIFVGRWRVVTLGGLELSHTRFGCLDALFCAGELSL